MALPSITLRNTKGSALTFTEMDNNLTNLQTANIQITSGETTSNIGLNSSIEFLSNSLDINITDNQVSVELPGVITSDTNGFGGISAKNINDGAGAVTVLNLTNDANTPMLLLKTSSTYDTEDDNLDSGDAALLNVGGNMTVGSITNNVKLFAGGSQEENVVLVGTTDGNVELTRGNLLLTSGGIDFNGQYFSADEIGYRNMPQVAAGNVTLALTDSGKHYYSTASTPTTVTIPNNANVAFATGTVITVVNQGTGNITIARQNEANLYLGGNATIANRTISTYGVATLLKVATNTWFINGTGVV
jgi:hypothetical protein